MAFGKVNPKQSFPALEKNILEYWEKNDIFNKSVNSRPKDNTFSFYDGPPFATGLPHYGHLLAGTIKDVIPRFKTMQGYRVERIWGWDTHGLPIENIVEQELEIKTKDQVEDLGIDKFNELCRSKVLAYAEEWKKIVGKTGRWVDMDNAYLTMNPEFMESVWWVFSELYKNGLVYDGHKVMPYCPRCATPLSNMEVGQGYKDKRDKAVTVKFELADEPGTYLLAWTTTPWTLPGNLALSIGPKINYSKVKTKNGIYILATDRLESYANELANYELIDTFLGKNLVGKEYRPVFDYYSKVLKETQNAKSKAFVVIDGNHVTTTEGTGIVHTAPAFGEDDYLVAKKHGIDYFMPVDDLGNFTIEVPDYAGKSVVTLETNEQIIKDLRDKVFRIEGITHSYPHCWRCDTPLIYKGVSSWFVAVEKVKSQMLTNNQSISWVPDSVGHSRFKKLIENAPDWSISRNRFWGTPLPVWKCDKCQNIKVVGSVEELRASINYPLTKLIIFRHGEAENSALGIRSSSTEKYHLTDKGIKTAKENADSFPDNIDVIISSPTLRAKETAEIIKSKIGDKAELVFNVLLAELNFGEWEDISKSELVNFDDYKLRECMKNSERFVTKFGKTGESRADSVERMRELLKKVTSEYLGKTVLLVTHGAMMSAFQKVAQDIDVDAYYSLVNVSKQGASRGSAETFYLDSRGDKIDLHKHFMDKVEFSCDECSGKMKLSGEVFDCWFESGSMPYGSVHYPFENKEKFASDYPADFIAEGIDQTRGWFYSLLVLSTALAGPLPRPKKWEQGASFKNVIVNGTVLAETGQKMSKKLRNYPDPMEVVDKYGADAMRFYLMASPAVHAEDFRFSEKGVDEVVKKVMITLWHSYSFFVTYATIDGFVPSGKLDLGHSMDRWIVSELNKLVEDVTLSLEAYDISKATRLLAGFVDNLSNWYIRRSRRRFWKSENDLEKTAAYETLYFVLVTYVKLLAPFMPFISDSIYKNLVEKTESVHLSAWPQADKGAVDAVLNEEIGLARKIVESGLRLRANAGVNVRQPLKSLYVASVGTDIRETEIRESIKEELNVQNLEFIKTGDPKADGLGIETASVIKLDFRVVGPRLGDKVKLVQKALGEGDYEVMEDGSVVVAGESLSNDEIIRAISVNTKRDTLIYEDNGTFALVLDVAIDDTLKAEGFARELVRKIQDSRKKAGFNVDDRIKVALVGDDIRGLLTKEQLQDLCTETLATSLEFEKLTNPDYNEKVQIDNIEFDLELIKI